MNTVTLAAAGIADGGELEIKDLGPQVSWTTVFLIEYVCTCCVMSVTSILTLCLPRSALSSCIPSSTTSRGSSTVVQSNIVCFKGAHTHTHFTLPVLILRRYVYFMVMAHFLKREYETLFVHRFSHATMPIFNIFRKYVSFRTLQFKACSHTLYAARHITISLVDSYSHFLSIVRHTRPPHLTFAGPSGITLPS